MKQSTATGGHIYDQIKRLEEEVKDLYEAKGQLEDLESTAGLNVVAKAHEEKREELQKLRNKKYEVVQPTPFNI